MWIICDQGHAINLDHFTRLDWKKAEGENANHYEVLAVRDFRHLGMVQRWDDKAKDAVPDVAVQTFRICNRRSEQDAKDTVAEIISELSWWIAPEQRQPKNLSTDTEFCCDEMKTAFADDLMAVDKGVFIVKCKWPIGNETAYDLVSIDYCPFCGLLLTELMQSGK